MTGSEPAASPASSRNLLPNPSFEAGDTAPQGWTFRGPAEHFRASWAREEAHSGERCLAFHPDLQDAAWESEPAPVAPGQPYGLLWWTRFEGGEPWHWSYHSKFVGVVVRLLGAKGDEVARVERKFHCLQTAGWQQAWIQFTTPAKAKKAAVAFVFRTGIGTDGHVWVDDVELQPLSPAPPVPDGHARVVLRTVDPSGRPIPARMWVRTANGEYAFPRYCYRFREPDTGFHAAVDDCWVDVPAGEVTVGARRGFEYQPTCHELRIEAGETRELELVLQRTINMPEHGWVAGDHHSHLFFHKHTQHPQMRLADSFEIAKAEGLNYLSLDGEMMEFRANLRDKELARDEEFVGEVGLEAVTDFYGHLCLIGVREDMPGGFPMRTVYWPPNEMVLSYVAEQGGAVIWAHPLSDRPLADLFSDVAAGVRGTLARELAVDILLGRRVSYDVYSHNDPPVRLTDVLTPYYHLLNLGREVGITASTDHYVDQGRAACGSWRTYARCERLDFAAVAQAYREGRTFATNGPLVMLQVNGAAPGDEVSLRGAGEVEVALRAVSQWSLEAGELVVNGRVRQRWDATDGMLDVKEPLRLDETSWVAARVFGPNVPEVDASPMSDAEGEFAGQFAHTCPVYVRVGGADFGPRREAVEFCLKWVEAMEAGVSASREKYLSADVSAYGLSGAEAYERVMSLIAQARRIGREMLRRAV